MTDIHELIVTKGMTVKEINGQTYFFVEVPEDAKDFKITWVGWLSYRTKTTENGWGGTYEKVWSCVNKQIIGKANELKDEQIRLLIQSVSKYHVNQKLNQQSQYDIFWVDVNGRTEYFDKKSQAYDFAFKMELQSILSSIGMKQETTVILKLNKP